MKKQFKYYVLILLLSVLGSACTTKMATPKAWLTKDVEVTLPAPARDKELHLQQLLSTTYQDKTHSLVVLLDAKDNEITLVGLTPIGIRLFTAEYNKNGIQSKKAMPIPNLPKANQVLADIMLAHWPTGTWTDHLPESWTLEDVGDTRYLKNEKNEIITEIHYKEQNGMRIPTTIKHHVFGYSLQLDDMDNNEETE